MKTKFMLIIAIALTIIVGGLEVVGYNATGSADGAWLSVVLVIFVWVVYVLHLKGIVFADKSNGK